MRILTALNSKNSIHALKFCLLLLAGFVILYLFSHKKSEVREAKSSSSLDISKILHHPSPRDQPYNLASSKQIWFSQYGQDKEIVKIFRNKTNGFFIEAGALDGEQFSNTLYMERNLGWTGLLVEPIPRSYKALLRKNRKAYSINACFSPNSFSAVMPVIDTKAAALASLSSGSNPNQKTVNVTCFPFFDILKAVGNPVVDYFSLDIEGFEMKILRTIPWDKVKIRFIGIEINHVPEGKAAVKTYMEQQGFKFYKKIKIDYYFYKPELAEGIDLSYIDRENL